MERKHSSGAQKVLEKENRIKKALPNQLNL